jgi:hypothetical protein
MSSDGFRGGHFERSDFAVVSDEVDVFPTSDDSESRSSRSLVPALRRSQRSRAQLISQWRPTS